MKVPISVVRRMKATFRDSRDIVRLSKASGYPISDEEAKAMWRGDFGDVRVIQAEVFFLMCGARLHVTDMKHGKQKL